MMKISAVSVIICFALSISIGSVVVVHVCHGFYHPYYSVSHPRWRFAFSFGSPFPAKNLPPPMTILMMLTNTPTPSEENANANSAKNHSAEVTALLAAAAKARADADRLHQELGQPTSTEVAATAKAMTTRKSATEVASIIPTLMKSGGGGGGDSTTTTQQWQALQAHSTVFGSANVRTYPVSLTMLEQRTGLTAKKLGLVEDSSNPNNVNLDDFKYATLYVTGGSAIVGVAALALLPPNIGATVCYLVALIPILFLAVGSTAPQLIADAIARFKGLKSSDVDAAGVQVQLADRICRHEAAHLCCGYWCGIPVADYCFDKSRPRVEFNVAAAEPRGYSSTQVAALAVTSLGGSVGEALTFGNAAGAAQDLVLLQSIFQRAADFYGAASQQDVTRWAALTAALLLRQNHDKYEQINSALSRQASVEECIQILES